MPALLQGRIRVLALDILKEISSKIRLVEYETVVFSIPNLAKQSLGL